MNKKIRLPVPMLETRLIRALQDLPPDEEIVLTTEDIACEISTSRIKKKNPQSMQRARFLLKWLHDMKVVKWTSGYTVTPGPRGGLEKATLSGSPRALIAALTLLRKERKRPRFKKNPHPPSQALGGQPQAMLGPQNPAPGS